LKVVVGHVAVDGGYPIRAIVTSGSFYVGQH
jgi:hypothetical protein